MPGLSLLDSFQGLPFSTNQCYQGFKNHLVSTGFRVYPFEFECIGSYHPYVDIAAKMGSMYWAFEYKSANDSISRGVEQLRCYSEWFDYVVLVSERQLDHKKSENYWDLKGLGAGMWRYDPESDRCFKNSNPLLQTPAKSNRTYVIRRFSTMRRRFKEKQSESLHGRQTFLWEYMQS